MTTYSTIRTALQQETHEPADDSVLDRHIVSALKHLRGFRFSFSEKTYTLSTESGKSEYKIGVELPGDILSVDYVGWIQSSTSGVPREVKPIPIQQLRRVELSSSSAVGMPAVYSFYKESLIFYPTPGSGEFLQIDYQADPARDELTGSEITVANVTGDETNEFFRRAEELVRMRALYTYSIGRSRDQDAATMAKLLYNEAFKSLMAERDGKQLDGQQVGFYL